MIRMGLIPPRRGRSASSRGASGHLRCPCGGFLTQTEEIGLLGGNSLPLGQVCAVGVAGPGKVGQVIYHLSAEAVSFSVKGRQQ